MSYAALPTLRTPRLTLRPLAETDADAIVAGVGNYDVSKWLGRVPYPYGRADALAFVAKVQAGGHLVWGVEDASGLVGIAGVQEELGYWLARPAWGKGYGFEAAHAVTAHWFADPAAGDLPSGHYSDNARSRAILEALGFEQRGESLRFARSLSQAVMGADLVLTRARWEARARFDLQTQRLRLRPIEARDAAAFSALTVPEVTRMMGRLPTHMSEAEVLEALPRRQWRGLANFTLVVEYQGQVIGTVAFGGAPLSLAFFLAPAHWGQGLMSEALEAFVPALFARFPMSVLHADHFEDNPASGAILRKLGFEETGRGMATSMARLEPAPCINYALRRDKLRKRL